MSAIAKEVATPVIPNYRKQLKEALPPHALKPSLKPLWVLVPNALLIGASLYLLANHFSWWTAPFLAILVGNCITSMGFLAHDIAHGGMIKQPVIRDVLAGICFSAFGISPYLWRRWHNADHHGHTQVLDEDPDHLLTMEHYKTSKFLRWLYRLSPIARNLVIFGSFSFRMCQHNLTMLSRYLRRSDVPLSGKAVMVAVPIIQMGAWVALTWSLGGWAVLTWGYLVPLLVANFIAISYIATNHFLNPLADERDVLATSLSVTHPRWLAWLDAWHLYFGSHVAHHLFPQACPLKGRYIEKVASELWPDRYHSLPMFTALKALWDTPWIYDYDGTHLINPHTKEKAPTLGHGL
jgi:fatty acid desaturase